MFAINAKTGKRAWKFASGRCVAASPAVADHVVFQSFLNRPPCNSKAKPGRLEGEVIAFASRLRAGSAGGRRSARPSPRRSSSTGSSYVGDWRGRVYALDGEHRPRPLDVPGQGPDQGRGRALRQPPLRRHLRRPPLRAPRADGEGDLADALAGSPRRPRAVLLDTGGRLRARLHRLDGRQDVLVRRSQREAALVAGHRRLRLLVAGRLAEESSTRAPTPAASTPSTRRRATSAGASTPAPTSPARPRC